MAHMDTIVLVYATFPSLDVAETAAATLVDSGLSACINIIPGMISVYQWQGERHRDQEVVLLAKTRRALGGQVIAAIKTLHPYETPAIFVLPVTEALPAFQAWIVAETQRAEARDAVSHEPKA